MINSNQVSMCDVINFGNDLCDLIGSTIWNFEPDGLYFDVERNAFELVDLDDHVFWVNSDGEIIG